MLPWFLFSAYLGTIVFVRATKNLDDLTHVKGIISNIRFMKHERRRKYETIYDDVLVVGVEGCGDEFGFIGKEYQKLLSTLPSLL